jgi:sugar lactone lactonase YvrE
MMAMSVLLALVAPGCSGETAEKSRPAQPRHVASASALTAGSGTLSVLAGVPSGIGSADGTGSAARFIQPRGVAVDGSGNVYVADTQNHTIRKVTPAGVVTTLAGSAGLYGSADGTGSAARFYNPDGVAVDGTGNVYVADTWNFTIRKVTPSGMVTTLAGSAGLTGSADGTGSTARFNYNPDGVAVDGTGNVYVADTQNHTLRKVTPAGVVTTLAGSAGQWGSADGTGSAARFYYPTGVSVDGTGSVYVADTYNRTIRKVTPAGVVTTLAGSAGLAGSVDGTGSTARFYYPSGVAVDGTGNVYVADGNNSTIRKVTPAGVVTTLAGLAGWSGSADGMGSAARFYYPYGVAVDQTGNVYVADSYNSTIRKVTSAGVVTTLAGSASLSGSADGTGSAARFYVPKGVTVGGTGDVYVADSANHTIRKISPAGAVTTLAGSVGLGGSADGTGSAARFFAPQGVAVDGSGNIYVADGNNSTIRKVTPAGVVTTLAGNAGLSGSADGTGSAARFYYPQGVAVDGSDNVYVADSYNQTIRKISPAGVVTTLAGSALLAGSADGTGTAARFYYPLGLAVDGSGNIYVADTSNQTVRKVTPNGAVSTLAGSAGLPGSADGSGSAARFYFPQGVAVDGAGNVYVAEYGNSTVRKVTPAGVVTTVVGVSTPTPVGNLPGPLPASIYRPTGVAVTADSGSLFIVLDSAVLVATGPLSITPATATVAPCLQTTFVASGGLPPYTWFLSVNASGGSISSTGVYTAGATGGVGDVVTVLDSLGASAVAAVTVPPALTVTGGGSGPVSVAAGGQVVLTASGGTGPYTFLLTTNGTGGSVTAGGVYTAGSQAGTDVVTVIDANGGTTTTTITVTSGPSWVMASAMPTARRRHTSTLLQSGKVLVVGGSDSAGTLATAVVYNPLGGGTWATTGALTQPRSNHAAVLLQSGKVLVVGGSGGTTAELYDPATEQWAPTGSIGWTCGGSPRVTLLPSGRVLLLGDDTNSGRAALYDPVAGTWSTTGTLQTPRLHHTATYLPSIGKVLVTGGYVPGGALTPSAELYDPATGSWSLTGAMAGGRTDHAATVVDGKVLVVGGYGGRTDAELYDPATGTWSPTGAMATGRSAFTLTVLASGKALVTGGTSTAGPTASAEFYDPATGTWSAVASLVTATAFHTATTLASGKVLVAGGDSGGGPIAGAQEYDPSVGSWSATGAMAVGRWSATSTLLPTGKLLVAGGWSAGGAALSSAELYDSTAGAWSATGSLASARADFTATLLPSGKVLVAGGHDASRNLTRAELYDPATGTWSATGSLSTPHHTHTATLLGSGKVLVVGGIAGGATAELYDPTTGAWTTTGSLAAPRWRHSATRLKDGQVLVVGGDSLAGMAELYDPRTGTWRLAGALQTQRYGQAAALVGSKVLIAGGWDSNVQQLASAELWDPATGSWSPTGSLRSGRGSAGSTVLPSGAVLVFGAYGAASSAERYDPESGAWTSAGALAAGRSDAVGTVLPSGKVLVVGGSAWSAVLASAELFDEGRGAQPGWTPSLTSAPARAAAGSTMAVGGTLFTGIGEGSSGNTQSSPTSYPLLELQAVDGGDIWFANTPPFSGSTTFGATSATVGVPGAITPGPYLARVVVGGVPSAAKPVVVWSLPAGPACTSATDCSAVGWGSNASGQLAPPSGLGAVKAIASNDEHALALKSDGTVVGWGGNYGGGNVVPPGLTGVTAISAGWGFGLALKSDGTIASWVGNSYFVPTVPAGLSGVRAIAAGDAHAVALKGDGTVAVWGATNLGQGNIPAGLSGVVAIAAGGWHNLALRSDGTVVAWGYNPQGQATVPAGLSGVVAVAAGYGHSMALRADGTVLVWGANNYGQLNVPAGLSGVTAIASGQNHCVALRSDGTVVAWGLNDMGQTTVAATLAGVTAIAAGGHHTVAVVTRPPLTISPVHAAVDSGLQRTFVASGGFTPHIWSLAAGGSGGSVSQSGVYTAGSTGNSTDILTVTDAIGMRALATVTVFPPLTVAGGGAVIVAAGGQVTLTASGGSGPYTFTLTTNGSGGSVSPDGVYTAGPAGGTDVVTVTDGNGGTSTVTITVTPGQGGGGGGVARGAPALDPLRTAFMGVVLALLGLLALGARFPARRRRRGPGAAE